MYVWSYVKIASVCLLCVNRCIFDKARKAYILLVTVYGVVYKVYVHAAWVTGLIDAPYQTAEGGFCFSDTVLKKEYWIREAKKVTEAKQNFDNRISG